MANRLHHGMSAALFAAVLFGVPPGPAAAQMVDSLLWVTDGYVTAVVRSGNTVYISGQFAYVGPITGGAVALDAATASASPHLNVNGQVYAAVPDGSSGWYIGGAFSDVGGEPRQNLAHVLADGTLSTWNPGASGLVWSIAVSGSTVYAGGYFTSIGGQPRNSIAALDASTGQATAWNPGANYPVYALAVSGSTVYAGGDFTRIGGQPRSFIAALDASTGGAAAGAPRRTIRCTPSR